MESCPEPPTGSRTEPRADSPRLRVLGVDPGLTRCGLAVVAGSAARPRTEDVRVVRTDSEEPIADRLRILYAGVGSAIEDHRPGAVAVEQVLFSRNVRTAMATGQAAGVVLLAAAHAELPVATYSPTEVKLTVAGHGGADKQTLARMVLAQLGLDEVPGPADATDALAVALCHLAGARAAQAGDGRAPTTWEERLAERPHLRTIGGTA